jgi:2-methylcitrate dehydratase PrpD
MSERHRLAFADWLACAARGAREPAALAARGAGDGLLERVAAAGAAGHVLDFDDTYAPGLAHLSAATAPAALLLAAELGADTGAALDAYAAGFEAMAVLARQCHPALYDGGWHPTAVCGGAGAAVAAARLLGLDAQRTRRAIAIALLRASGLRAAFGSDGKALQVGLAAAAGVHAARLAAAGARVDADAIAGAGAGFAEAFGVATGAATLDAMLAAAAVAADEGPAAQENWIKAYPCCLQTHAAIDAALQYARAAAPRYDELAVVVHPVSRRAAALDAVADGLQAKFSIPYTTAYALLRGEPGIDAFERVDSEVAALAGGVRVRTDATLAESEAILERAGRAVARVITPRGSPGNPLGPDEIAAKARALAGSALDGALDDAGRPAAALRGAAGL